MGNSSIFSFKEMLQHYSQSGKTGCFEILSKAEQGRIFIVTGSVIHAQLGNLDPEDAAIQMLTWEDATYKWHEGMAPNDTTMAVPVQDLLLRAIIVQGEKTSKESTNDRLIVSQERPIDLDKQKTRNILDPGSVRVMALEISSNELKPFRFVLKKKQTTVGRGEENDLCLSDTSCSRKHALIIHSNDNLIVRDLGSMNGTYIDDQIITEGIAKKDQVIVFGEVSCRLSPSVVRKVPAMSAIPHQ
ncbi:MAG: FHA domain-containing protein [Verrucomicrobiota bacterium]